MSDAPKQPSMLEFIRGTLLWFLVFYGIFLGYNYFVNGSINSSAEPTAVVHVSPVSSGVVTGNLAAWNLSDEAFANRPDPCTDSGSVALYRPVSGQRVDVLATVPCEAKRITDQNVTFPELQNTYMNEPGTYILVVGEHESAPIEISKAGAFRRLFRAMVSQPLFNLLAGITNALPGKSFGWGIVLLTLLVRLLLFIPNQRALASQKKMQLIQPQLQAIQTKYKDDQQTLAMKTMELYRTQGVNPASGCMPILLQMPFLLGIYYIVQDGLSPHLEYLLYGFMDNVSLTGVQTDFLGLDLNVANVFPLPIIVAVAQWFALRLGFQNKPGNAKPAEGMAGQMQQMQGMMQWVMPAMIGFFTATFPAGVGIYWVTSTVFGIFQQILVRRQLAS